MFFQEYLCVDYFIRGCNLQKSTAAGSLRPKLYYKVHACTKYFRMYIISQSPLWCIICKLHSEVLSEKLHLKEHWLEHWKEH